MTSRRANRSGRPACPAGGGIFEIYDASNGEKAREVARNAPGRTALSADGRFVVVAYDNAIVGIGGATGQTRWSSPTVSQPGSFVKVVAVQFESNPPWFHAAFEYGNVIRFNGLTGHEQRRFLADVRTPEQQKAPGAGESAIFTAAFSADGGTMASSCDGWVCLWDIAAGALRRKIRYPHTHGGFLALSPDGKTLAIADDRQEQDVGEDKIRLYDVETGEPVLALEAVDDRAHVLAFSPDGTKLLTGLKRGSAIVWDVRRGHGQGK